LTARFICTNCDLDIGQAVDDFVTPFCPECGMPATKVEDQPAHRAMSHDDEAGDRQSASPLVSFEGTPESARSVQGEESGGAGGGLFHSLFTDMPSGLQTEEGQPIADNPFSRGRHATAGVMDPENSQPSDDAIHVAPTHILQAGGTPQVEDGFATEVMGLPGGPPPVAGQEEMGGDDPFADKPTVVADGAYAADFNISVDLNDDEDELLSPTVSDSFDQPAEGAPGPEMTPEDERTMSFPLLAELARNAEDHYLEEEAAAALAEVAIEDDDDEFTRPFNPNGAFDSGAGFMSMEQTDPTQQAADRAVLEALSADDGPYLEHTDEGEALGHNGVGFSQEDSLEAGWTDPTLNSGEMGDLSVDSMSDEGMDFEMEIESRSNRKKKGPPARAAEATFDESSLEENVQSAEVDLLVASRKKAREVDEGQATIDYKAPAREERRSSPKADRDDRPRAKKDRERVQHTRRSSDRRAKEPLRVVGVRLSLLAIMAIFLALAGIGAGAALAPAPKNQLTNQQKVARERFAAGNKLFSENEFDAALGAYRESMAADPAFASAHRGAATALARLERNEEAAAAYESFLKVAPESPEAPQIKAMLERFKIQLDRAKSPGR
jgi:tetratricopeptide (TPR) repeat protein